MISFPGMMLLTKPSIFNEASSKELMVKDDPHQINVKDDEKMFQVSLDTSAYRPDELKINVDEKGLLSVEAQHEEKSEDRQVSRSFLRKFTLPQGCRAETVSSNLSADGVLMVTAPKMALEAVGIKHVPIQQN